MITLVVFNLGIFMGYMLESSRINKINQIWGKSTEQAPDCGDMSLDPKIHTVSPLIYLHHDENPLKGGFNVTEEDAEPTANWFVIILVFVFFLLFLW